MSSARDRAKFAAILRSAMTKRNVNNYALAEAIGTSPSSIYGYRAGKFLPTIQVAERLADALVDGTVSLVVIQMRTRHCAVCDRETVDRGTKPRKFCSVACERLSIKGVSTKPNPDARDLAIAEMCAGCEPGGRCVTIECPLRAFSPLPYVEPSRTAPARTGIMWTEERRAATSKRFRAYWADEDHVEARRLRWRDAQRRSRSKSRSAA